MSLLDGLGIGDGSSEAAARQLRENAMAKVVSLMPGAATGGGERKVVVTKESVGVPPFLVSRGEGGSGGGSFSLEAPTTSCNLERYTHKTGPQDPRRWFEPNLRSFMLLRRVISLIVILAFLF